MWGLSDDKKAKKQADILFGLFDKYESNLKKGTKLYRGMSVPDEIFMQMGYDRLRKGDKYTPDDKAIASFSKLKKVAYDFALDGEHKNKVILKIVSDNKSLIDISKLSIEQEEKEVLLSKNIWYNISHIKKYNTGGIKWMLIILKK